MSGGPKESQSNKGESGWREVHRGKGVETVPTSWIEIDTISVILTGAVVDAGPVSGGD